MILREEEDSSPLNMSPSVLKCLKEGHNHQTIQSVCLSRQCQGNRQLCKNCFFEHRLHIISTLNGSEFDPLTILSINSQQENSKQIGQSLKNMYEDINKNFFTNIISIIQKHQLQFAQKLNPDFEAVWRSFDQNTSTKAIQKIKKCLGKQNKSINFFTQMLQILIFSSNHKNLRDLQFIKNISEYQQERLNEINAKLCESINKAFEVMQTQIIGLKIKNINYENLLQKKRQKKNDCVNDKKLIQISKQISQQCSIMTVKKQYQQNDKIDIMKIIKVDELNDQKGGTATISQFQIGKAKQISNWLKSKNIKRLNIKSNYRPKVIKDECIDFICQIPSIRSLNLQWANQISTESIQKIINKLNLLQLSLENCSNFNKQCVKIISKKLPKLQILHYGVDFRNSLKQYHQSLYFMEQDRDYALNLYQCFTLVSTLKSLRNIWIGQCNEKQTPKIIKKITHLKDITLGQFAQNFNQLKVQIIQVLKPHAQLRSITLLSIECCQLLKTALPSFSSLQSLVFIWCKQIDDQLCKAISDNCKSLNQLSLDTCEANIKGDSLWKLTKLKVLILTKSNSIDQNTVLKELSNLKKLQFLDLRQNNWVNDQVAKVISNFSSLKYLSVAVTPITDLGFQSFSSLKKLQSIICGHSKISGKALCKLSSHCHKIKKISIAGLDGKEQYGQVTSAHLKSISENNAITHLNIYNCNQLGNQIFAFLPELVCVTLFGSQVTQQCKSMLKYKGVYVQDKQ